MRDRRTESLRCRGVLRWRELGSECCALQCRPATALQRMRAARVFVHLRLPLPVIFKAILQQRDLISEDGVKAR